MCCDHLEDILSIHFYVRTLKYMEDCLECPVCHMVLSQSPSRHVKHCQKRASQLLKANNQLCRGMNIRSFMNEHVIYDGKDIDIEKSFSRDGLEPPPQSFECPICFKDATIIHYVRTTPCGHRFCEPCISRWLQKHDTCPLCKAAQR